MSRYLVLFGRIYVDTSLGENLNPRLTVPLLMCNAYKDGLPFRCRLGEDQREYVDRKGIHVVVGHYMGEAAASPSLNLTDGEFTVQCLMEQKLIIPDLKEIRV